MEIEIKPYVFGVLLAIVIWYLAGVLLNIIEWTGS